MLIYALPKDPTPIFSFKGLLYKEPTVKIATQ